MRSERIRDLLRILRSGEAASQQDIVDRLRAAGHEVTQATVSRDLRSIGATKIRANGHHVYRLPDHLPRTDRGDLVSAELSATLQRFAVEIRRAGTLVVVLTAPGHAAAVARAIDLSGHEQVVGTVAGDDTIFVATPSEAAAETLARSWGGIEPVEVSG